MGARSGPDTPSLLYALPYVGRYGLGTAIAAGPDRRNDAVSVG